MRNFSDLFISNFNSIKYHLTEKVRLKIARLIHDGQYKFADEQPLISVCIPTYNRGAILVDRAIKSVLTQTYKNIELVIIGDCCDDETAELISRISDPRIKFYNLTSRKKSYPQTVENHWLAGPVNPLNKALELAQGKWLARIDDDDTWPENHLERLYKFACAGNYEFVSALYIEERFNQRKIVDGVRALDEYYAQRKIPNADKSAKIGGVSTWLYRSYLSFIKYNPDCWRKSWNRVNDIDLSLRIYHSGARMGFLEEVMAYVLPRPGEKSVGLEAYKLDEKAKLQHFNV